MAEYIDREVLCKILENWRNAHADVDDEHGCGLLEDVICEVDAQTAADVAPVVHWVLTDEKLPPEGQDVLCWYEYFRFGSYNRMFQTYGIGYQYNGMWGGEVAQGQKARVLAWIPLPETPKMDGGDNNAAD